MGSRSRSQGSADAEGNWFARVDAKGELVGQRTFTTTFNTDDFLGIVGLGKGAVMFGSYGVNDPDTTPGWALAVDGFGIDWELRPGKQRGHSLCCGVPLADGGLMALGDVWLRETNNTVPT